MEFSLTIQSHLKYMLVFIIVILFPKVHADCPVSSPCYCRVKKLICNNIGNVLQVPPFRPSSTKYDILNISNTPALTTLQNNAFSGLRVKHIELFHLGLTKIEANAFSGLDSTFSTLVIVHTYLDNVRDYVFNPIKNVLRILALEHNRLSTLSPTAFSKLTQLRLLSLDCSNVTSLTPTLFSHLTQLRNLHLHFNQLESIPDDLFSNLTQLQILSLDSINLTTLSRALLRHQTKLGRMRIYNNPLETISDDAFSNLRTLLYLSLHHNKLTTLSSALFSHIPQLITLDLSFNLQESISADTFSKLTKLKTLSIHDNKLTTLSSHLFSNLIHLTFLKIVNNPFICDCHLDWLRNSTLHTHGIIKGDPICFNPPNVKGVSVMTYTTSPCTTTSSTVIIKLTSTESPTTRTTMIRTLPTDWITTTKALPQETLGTTRTAFQTVTGLLFLLVVIIIIVTIMRWFLVARNRPKSFDGENRYHGNQANTAALHSSVNAVIGDEIGASSQISQINTDTGHENLGLSMEQYGQRTHE